LLLRTGDYLKASVALRNFQMMALSEKEKALFKGFRS